MRKRTIYICEKKDTDQLCGNRKADLAPLFSLQGEYNSSTFQIQNFQFLAICACTARLVADLFGNHIVGFPMRWLK